VEHEIIRDHSTNRSRGFGFVVFDAEKTVDELLAKKGNMIDLNGSQVRLGVLLFEVCNSTSLVQLCLHMLINCVLPVTSGRTLADLLLCFCCFIRCLI
jgi:hypothetical protein